MKSKRIINCKIISIISLALFALITNVVAQIKPVSNDVDNPHLGVFSVSAAGRWVCSGKPMTEEIKSVGHISRIWATLIDKSGDLLLVGERDPNAPCLHISDVCTALRTYKNVSLSKTSPGVSIDPLDSNRYEPFQKVRFFGGVEHTHYGRVVLEADILLKLLSTGLILPSIDSLPSDLALQIYRQKSAMMQDPWLNQLNNSWFYPVSIGRQATDSCIVITHTTIKVFDGQDAVSELPRGDLSVSMIFDYVNKHPENVSPVFSALVTRKYDELSKVYPVLTEMKNVLGLSALFSGLFETIQEYNGKWFWETVFDPHDSRTPELIPTVNIAEIGLGYSYGVSGGIVSEFYSDPWTLLALQRTPKYLKEGAILSRPNVSDPITWAIPLGYGKPSEWSNDLIGKLNKSENERIESECHKKQGVCSCKNQQDLLNIIEHNLPSTPYLIVPGWHPNTTGNHVAYFSGGIIFNTGGSEIYSPDRILSIGNSDLSTGAFVKAGLILKNRLEFRLELPFIIKSSFGNYPSNLPGISTTVIQLKGGLESPTFRVRASLLNGLKKGRFTGTSLIFDNSITPRFHWKWFSPWIAGRDSKHANEGFLPFGRDETITSHALDFSRQFENKVNLQLSIVYLRAWYKEKSILNKPNGAFLLTPSFYFDAGKESRLIFGFKGVAGFKQVITELDPLTLNIKKAFRNEDGWQLSGIMAFPNKFGYDSFSLGWYFPKKTPENQTRGGFILELNLDGSRLWDTRKWFDKLNEIKKFW